MSNDKVNWKQARVDAAVAAMNGLIANSHDEDFRVTERYSSYDCKRKRYPHEIAEYAVILADALIAELQRVKTNE